MKAILFMIGGFCIAVPAFLLVSANRADRGLLGPGAVFLLLLVIALGRTLFTVGLDSAKVSKVRPAGNVLQQDDRPPIVYLRSFSLDDLEINRTTSFTNKFVGHATRIEETLSSILRLYGPAVALGDPSDRSPIPGFARMWVSHEDWQEKILSLLTSAQLVVMMLGPARLAFDENLFHNLKIKQPDKTTLSGLEWEFVTILDKIPPERIILVIPPVDNFESYWGRFCELSKGKLSGAFNKDIRFITFSADWTQRNFTSWNNEESNAAFLLAKVLRSKASFLYRKKFDLALNLPLDVYPFLPKGK